MVPIVPLIVFLFTIPLFFLSDYWLRWMIYFGIAAIAVLGLHILTGLCGQFSLGQAAFMAVGAYTAAILTSKSGRSCWATLPLAGIMAGLVGLIFGAPSLRIKGFYLIMATLAAQFIIMWFFNKFEWFGGSMGLSLKPLKLGGVNFRDAGTFYTLTMVLLIVMTFFAKNLQRTKTGRVFIAIRDNDLAAEVMGINLFRYKLLAFFIGCFYAGIAGWLWAYSQGRINPGQFLLKDSIWYLGMLVIGGMGSTTGALIGTAGVKGLDVMVDYLSRIIGRSFPSVGAQIFSGGGLMLFALVIIFILIFEPRGLYHRWEIIKSTYRLYPYSY
jgi:branched-chain amino acid transport system permease protein